TFLRPGMLMPMPVADRAQGIWTQPLQAAACSGVSGASEAPKSTVRAVIWEMPVPEPTAEYLTGIPSLISNPLIQFCISGATSVEPAPVRAAEAFAVATVAMPPTVPASAMKMPSNLLRIKTILSREIRLCRVRIWAPERAEDSRRQERKLCQ